MIADGPLYGFVRGVKVALSQVELVDLSGFLNGTHCRRKVGD